LILLPANPRRSEPRSSGWLSAFRPIPPKTRTARSTEPRFPAEILPRG
jgi:hypothetical protein